MRVCVDAGHGGTDPGAIGPNGTYESAVTLAMVPALVAAFADYPDHRLDFTRVDDVGMALEARATRANAIRADVFVSIHANAAANTDVHGMEVYHFPGSEQGAALAHRIGTAMKETFPYRRWRGVKEANFAVLRLTDMPAVLVELDFISHPEQEQKLQEPRQQRLFADAIVKGIDRWSKEKHA